MRKNVTGAMKAILKRRMAPAGMVQPESTGDVTSDSCVGTPDPAPRPAPVDDLPAPAQLDCGALAAPSVPLKDPSTGLCTKRREVHAQKPEVQVSAMVIDCDNQVAGSSAAEPVASQPSTVAAASGPEDACRVAGLRERAESMLLGDGERPRSSSKGRLVIEATNGLLIDARFAVSELWEACADDIRAACAPTPIDEMDAYGYVLADALGRPLLHEDDAGDVGRCAHVQQGRAATKWKTEERKAAGAVRKATAAAAAKPQLSPRIAAAQAAGDTACTAVLTKTYNLNLPLRCAGKRKREQTDEVTDEEAAVAAAEEATKAASKAVTAAQSRQKAATQVAHGAWSTRAQAAARVQSIEEQITALGPQPDMAAFIQGEHTPSALKVAEAWYKKEERLRRRRDREEEALAAAQEAAEEADMNATEAALEVELAVARKGEAVARERLAQDVAGLAALEAAGQAAAVAAEEAEAVDGDEDGVWWDDRDAMCMLFEERDAMVAAVAATAAGFTRCAHCAYLLVREAQDRMSAPEPHEEPLELTRAHYDAWKRSQPFNGLYFSAGGLGRCRGCRPTLRAVQAGPHRQSDSCG